MDRDKDKGRASKNLSTILTSDKTPAGSQHGSATRSEINALITGSPGPITNPLDARKWLETKGWILSGEDYDRSKMVKILLTISMLPKMPQEAINAVRAVI
ncbi:hypothetical protein BYT27DRAFT_7260485 [Phlegmacium glaucopus]|nr:hypothetical protein BYT27DRAFT_7260485 [Phlegmacium glaucopus]